MAAIELAIFIIKFNNNNSENMSYRNIPSFGNFKQDQYRILPAKSNRYGQIPKSNLPFEARVSQVHQRQNQHPVSRFEYLSDKSQRLMDYQGPSERLIHRKRIDNCLNQAKIEQACSLKNLLPYSKASAKQNDVVKPQRINFCYKSKQSSSVTSTSQKMIRQSRMTDNIVSVTSSIVRPHILTSSLNNEMIKDIAKQIKLAKSLKNKLCSLEYQLNYNPSLKPFKVQKTMQDLPLHKFSKSQQEISQSKTSTQDQSVIRSMNQRIEDSKFDLNSSVCRSLEGLAKTNSISQIGHKKQMHRTLFLQENSKVETFCYNFGGILEKKIGQQRSEWQGISNLLNEQDMKQSIYCGPDVRADTLKLSKLNSFGRDIHSSSFPLEDF